MRDVLVFGNKSFSEFNTFTDLSKAFGTAKKTREYYDIEGRNGSLASSSYRFEDIVLSFPCFIRSDFITNYRSLMAYLSSVDGYQKLESSKEPNYFRKACFEGGIDPQTTPFNHGGYFTVEFRCNPQRWLKSGEEWVSFTADGSIFNPTLQTAKPIIRIYGTGSVMIGSKTITVSTAGTNYIDFDCETQDAYEGSNNRNSNISTNFDEIGLAPGLTGIDLTGVTVDIMPRWWDI